MKENKFAKARKVMKETFEKDKGLLEGYVANVAMLLLDEQERNSDKDLVWKKGQLIDLTIPLNRNKLAEKILKLIFSLEA